MRQLLGPEQHQPDLSENVHPVARGGSTSGPSSTVVLSLFLLVASVYEPAASGLTTVGLFTIVVALAVLLLSFYILRRSREPQAPFHLAALLGTSWLFGTSSTMALLAYFSPNSIPAYTVGGVGILVVAGAPAWPSQSTLIVSSIVALLPVSVASVLDDPTSTNLMHVIPFVFTLMVLAIIRYQAAAQAQAGLQHAFKRLRYMAHHDALTGQMARHHWLNSAQDAITAAEANTPVAIMYIDIDDFKHINDTHGHEAGDQALVSVTSMLAEHAPENALIGRIGGDEIAICLPGYCCTDAKPWADHLLGHTDIRTHGLPFVTISIGIACTYDVATLPDLLHRADTAMLRAKRLGRNRVEVFAESSEEINA